MKPRQQGGRRRDPEVRDISDQCARFSHVAAAHDRTVNAEAGREQTRRLLPWARRLALGTR